MNLAQLEAEICSLPVKDRAFLVQRLLLSLEEISESEFDSMWGETSLPSGAGFATPLLTFFDARILA